MPPENLSRLGEFGLIDMIASRVSQGQGVVTGIGDDAAVTSLSPGMQLLTSTDMLLEEVHFRRAWHDPYRLGRKSLAVSVSDIAAMGGIPRWALLSLALPADYPLDQLQSFTAGFLDLAGEHGVTLIGGDTCASRSGVVISVTIMGEQDPQRIIRRGGARPSDQIWVTGTLGDAALGLRLLEPAGLVAGAGEEAGYLISRLLDPLPRSAVGPALAGSGLVTAMIDVSDGLLADFGHIAHLSGVGGHIELEALPLSPQFRSQVALQDRCPHSLALAGGEDYELLFTAPPQAGEKIADLMKKCGVDARPVGIVTSSPGVLVTRSDGSPYLLPAAGFNHFT